MEAKQHSLQTLNLRDMLLSYWPLLVCQTLSITPRKFKIRFLSARHVRFLSARHVIDKPTAEELFMLMRSQQLAEGSNQLMKVSDANMCLAHF